ncbi:hypothetical protein ACFQU2_26535 [Siccirubricoccus deserti]
MTRAPACAAIRAVARPMPELAPVMTMVCCDSGFRRMDAMGNLGGLGRALNPAPDAGFRDVTPCRRRSGCPLRALIRRRGPLWQPAERP